GHQPLEEGGVLRVAARRPLVEVVVGVDEAGGDQAAARVDPGRGRIGWGGAVADGDDAIALDDHVAGRVLGERVVHCGYRGVVDDGPVHALIRLPASRTASRIFS